MGLGATYIRARTPLRDSYGHLVILYKRLGLSNADIALYTSWLYLPWVIKPIWSPFVDILKTKRWWIVSMRLLIGAGLANRFHPSRLIFLQATLAFSG